MWWYVLTCFLVVLAMFAFAAIVMVFLRRRKDLELKRVENEDGIWEIQFFDSNVSRSITIDDILSSAREENVITRGRKGMQFVVKEMINDVNLNSPSFWSVIARLGKVQHPNIVRLVGICVSEKAGFLVYEYAEGKVLSQILQNLSWERRRKIAIGIAKALQFLHGYCSPSILVGEMSPEKVMVDGKDEPRLSLGIPGLACTDTKCFISSAYVAPESRESKDMTVEGDMYGFGVVLIELLTGKSPADMEYGVHENIVEWARHCYSDCHLDAWIDTTIRGQAAGNDNKHGKEMVLTMNLALHCTTTDPTARPSASHVVKTLHSLMSPTTCVRVI